MPMGFSQSTGLPAATAVRTSCRWQALGVVTSTASTSGQRLSSPVDANTCGMPYCAAASRALLESRRDSATTLQSRARAKPGIRRRTACKPKPATPKRIMGGLLASLNRLRVRIKDEKQHRQSGQRPERRANLPQAPRNQFAERIQDEARSHANSHVVSKRHEDDDAERWNQFGEVVEGNAGDRSQHQQSHEDECRSVGLWRDGGDEWREEESPDETQRGDDRGQAGSAPGLYSSGGLDVGAGCGGANHGGKGCGQRVGHHWALDLRQVTVFVEEARARRHTDKGAHGVHKCHDKNRQDDRKKSPGKQTVQIELEKDRLEAGRTADPTCRRRRDPGSKTEKSSGQNAAKNRSRETANGEHRHQQETEDGKQNGKRSQMARPHRRAGRSYGDDAGLIQSDAGEEQSDANGVAVTKSGGNGVNHPLAEPEQGHQNKQDSGQEHRAQSALPRVAQHLNHSERDESVFAHVRTDGERAVGIEAHQQCSENGGEDGGRERSASRHAGSLQDGGIDGHDVSHREEGGESGDDFAANGCLVMREFKELIEPAVQVALGWKLRIVHSRRSKDE